MKEARESRLGGLSVSRRKMWLASGEQKYYRYPASMMRTTRSFLRPDVFIPFFFKMPLSLATFLSHNSSSYVAINMLIRFFLLPAGFALLERM